MTKIAGYETWIVRVPYGEGRSGTHIVLRLTTEQGVQGIGYITNQTKWALRAQHAAVCDLADRVVGADVMAAPVIMRSLRDAGARPQFDGLARSAAGVIDTALWDVKASTLGVPLFRLLGGERRQVPVYAGWDLWWQLEVDTVVRNAVTRLGEGFRGLKFRLGGITDAKAAAARTAAVREAVGEDVALMADANGAWSVPAAIEVGHALEPFGLRWLEDPVPIGDLAGLRTLGAALPIPLCAGETCHDPGQFRDLLDCSGVSVVMIDLEAGGVSEWLRVAALADMHHRPVTSHVCTEIAAHLVSATPNAVNVEYVPWARPLFTDPPPLRDGCLELSDEPGLGLHLDEEALRRFRLT